MTRRIFRLLCIVGSAYCLYTGVEGILNRSIVVGTRSGYGHYYREERFEGDEAVQWGRIYCFYSFALASVVGLDWYIGRDLAQSGVPDDPDEPIDPPLS